MKNILCFGDSNTWGFDPATQGRFGFEVRWPGVLRKELGAGYHVIEEGLGGRTTVWEDPIFPGRNGRAYLQPCLESHAPLDLVIILLGTNDVKLRFSASAFDSARGAGALVELARRIARCEVLLIAPPPIAELTEFAETFAGSREKSRRLAPHYAATACENGAHFLDAGQIIVSSRIDGIHWEAEEHRKLGVAVAEWVRRQS